MARMDLENGQSGADPVYVEGRVNAGQRRLRRFFRPPKEREVLPPDLGRHEHSGVYGSGLRVYLVVQ